MQTGATAPVVTAEDPLQIFQPRFRPEDDSSQLNMNSTRLLQDNDSTSSNSNYDGGNNLGNGYITNVQLPDALVIGFEGADGMMVKASAPKIPKGADRHVQAPVSTVTIKKPPPAVRSSSSWRGWEEQLEIETEMIIRGEEDKRKQMGSIPSFLLGVFMGINPLFIAVSAVVKQLRTTPERYKWHHSFFVYGRTLGLFLLILLVIVIIVLNIA